MVSDRKIISDSLETAWNNLHTHWQGTDADDFCDVFITKMKDTISVYEKRCSELGNDANECLVELQRLESQLYD